VILTGRVGLIALICVIPIAFSPWPAIVFGVLLAALVVAVIADIALAASPRRLGLSRLGETAARLGQPVDSVLVVENGGSRRFRGQIRDAWAPSARAGPRTHPVDIAAGQQVRLSTQLRPVRRGDQCSALVTARAIGPLGLAGRQGSHRVPWQIRILPPFLSRKHLPSRLAKLRELEGMTPVLIRGQGTEFDSLREYVIGDDVRSIDWRATARRGDVVVRTWRPERDRRVVIVLDTGRTSAGRVGVDPTASDPGGWPRLDLNASALDEGLMAVLPQLSAKHQVLIAAVADPRVEQLAAGRADAAQIYDAAAAERARNDRRAIASRLRRSGVDVVDAAPEELAPELADHYLAMKASGRL
jgi:uncharacterized protein (DUF58 family)